MAAPMTMVEQQGRGWLRWLLAFAEARSFRLLLWSGLAAQLLLVLLITSPWVRSSDSLEYLQLAEALSQGRYGGITAAGFEAEALRPPGYPAFLWLVLHVLHLPVVAAVVIQLAVYAACLALIVRWLRPIRFAPQLFLLCALIYLFPAIYVSALMSEAFAVLAMTVVALLATRTLSVPVLLGMGAVAALGAMFRPDLLLLPVAVTVALVLTQRFRLALLLPLLAAGVVLAPYTLYNAGSFGKLTPLPVASATGNSLYMSTWQDQLSQDDLNAFYQGRATRPAIESGLAGEVSRINRQIGVPPLTAPWYPKNYPDRRTQVLSSKLFGDAAKARIQAEPGRYARHVVGNVWKIWNTSVYPASTPTVAKLGLSLVSGLVLLLGLVGAVVTLVGPAGWPVPRIVALIFGYVPALQIWFHGEARYTTAVRPLLMMFAAVLVQQAVVRWHRRQQPEALPQAHPA